MRSNETNYYMQTYLHLLTSLKCFGRYGLSNLCRDAETTPRQREPRDAATDAETRSISDSIDRSLTRDTCDCDYCDYYDAERLMMIEGVKYSH